MIYNCPIFKTLPENLHYRMVYIQYSQTEYKVLKYNREYIHGVYTALPDRGPAFDWPAMTIRGEIRLGFFDGQNKQNVKFVNI